MPLPPIFAFPSFSRGLGSKALVLLVRTQIRNFRKTPSFGREQRHGLPKALFSGPRLKSQSANEIATKIPYKSAEMRVEIATEIAANPDLPFLAFFGKWETDFYTPPVLGGAAVSDNSARAVHKILAPSRPYILYSAGAELSKTAAPPSTGGV